MKFEIDKLDLPKFNKWREEHDCDFRPTPENPYPDIGAIGGTLTYSFTPTSIGTIVKVECACGSSVSLCDHL